MHTKLTALWMMMSAVVGCSGHPGTDVSAAPSPTPSAIAPAPPRAMGPGAARMTRSVATGLGSEPDELDEPLFPTPGMPDGGTATPGGGTTTEL